MKWDASPQDERRWTLATHSHAAFRAVSPAPHLLPRAWWRGRVPCNGAVPVADQDGRHEPASRSRMEVAATWNRPSHEAARPAASLERPLVPLTGRPIEPMWVCRSPTRCRTDSATGFGPTHGWGLIQGRGDSRRAHSETLLQCRLLRDLAGDLEQPGLQWSRAAGHPTRRRGRLCCPRESRRRRIFRPV